MSARCPLQKKGILKRSKPIFRRSSRTLSLEPHFSENRAADGVVVALLRTCEAGADPIFRAARSSGMSSCRRDRSLPGPLIWVENALEASLHTAPARRRIELTAYLHGNSSGTDSS